MDRENLHESINRTNKLIEEVMNSHSVDPDLFIDLVKLEESKVHLEKRRGVKDQIRKMIEEWIERTDE